MSHDDPLVAPEYAHVDPELLRTCPPALVNSCAFDTFCHAVESCWSKQSTPRARALATKALRLVTEALTRDLGAMSGENRVRLAQAATLGGQAINLTRTTAAHAFSYSLTARFGVPHGVACLLNLMWLIDHNVEQCAADVDLTPINAAVRTLAAALCSSQENVRPSDVIRAMLVRGGFSERLRDYGIGSADVPALVDAGLASNRAANNPVAIDRGFAIEQLAALV
jgi:alcohol dehydrogenase class IV